MKIKNDIAVSPIAGKLMHALQHSKSRKLQNIWKDKIKERKAIKQSDQELAKQSND